MTKLKAFCIDNAGQSDHLTLMKGYDVIYVDNNEGKVIIVDDTGIADDYSRERFVLKPCSP